MEISRSRSVEATRSRTVWFVMNSRIIRLVSTVCVEGRLVKQHNLNSIRGGVDEESFGFQNQRWHADQRNVRRIEVTDVIFTRVAQVESSTAQRDSGVKPPDGAISSLYQPCVREASGQPNGCGWHHPLLRLPGSVHPRRHDGAPLQPTHERPRTGSLPTRSSRPRPRPARGAVQQPVEHGGDDGAVVEDLAPPGDPAVGRERDAALEAATGDDLEERGGGQFTHSSERGPSPCQQPTWELHQREAVEPALRAAHDRAM